MVPVKPVQPESPPEAVSDTALAAVAPAGLGSGAQPGGGTDRVRRLPPVAEAGAPNGLLGSGAPTTTYPTAGVN